MENSPSCSSSGNTSPAQPPTFYRLSSEVVEKPAFEDAAIFPDFEMVPEGMEGSFLPVVLPNSPASTHTKSDHEVLSDAELEQGDVDEGFDEEFEDKDINDTEPNNFELNDLDPKELQQLLDDPQFDLGVDVLEQSPIISPPPINSTSYNFSSSPCSPYYTSSPCAVTAPSPCAVTSSTPTDMTRSLYYNDYNQVETPPSVQSNHSASTSASYGSRVDEMHSLALLQSEHDSFPDSTSEVLSLLSEGEVPVMDPPTPDHAPPHFQPSPVLSAPPPQSTGLDLAETGNLLLDNLIELSTALSAEASVDTQSMYMFGTGQLSLSPGSGLVPGHPSASAGLSSAGASTNVITLMDSHMLPQTSSEMRSTPVTPPLQRPTLSLNHQQPVRRSPSRSPVPPSSPPPPMSPGEQELSSEDKKLVDMPYYQFRKILDDPSVPERRKEEIKNIRRKGRNKIAAKVCRNKKMHLIMGLEKEVEQLRKMKAHITLKSKTLEKEIAELKRRCHNR